MIMAGEKLKAKSISFCSFTNRRFKIPLDVICKKFFDTFVEYVDENEGKTTL